MQARLVSQVGQGECQPQTDGLTIISHGGRMPTKEQTMSTWADVPSKVLLKAISYCDGWTVFDPQMFVKLGIPADLVESVTAIHQIHDYSHHPQGKEGVWKGPEAEANLKLVGGGTYSFILWDVTRILEPNGLKLALSRLHLKRRLETLAILYPKRTFRNLSLKILLSGLLKFYDLLVWHRVSREALAIARKLLAFVTTKIK
jgi:hypothetical protein